MPCLICPRSNKCSKGGRKVYSTAPEKDTWNETPLVMSIRVPGSRLSAWLIPAWAWVIQRSKLWVAACCFISGSWLDALGHLEPKTLGWHWEKHISVGVCDQILAAHERRWKQWDVWEHFYTKRQWGIYKSGESALRTKLLPPWPANLDGRRIKQQVRCQLSKTILKDKHCWQKKYPAARHICFTFQIKPEKWGDKIQPSQMLRATCHVLLCEPGLVVRAAFRRCPFVSQGGLQTMRKRAPRKEHGSRSSLGELGARSHFLRGAFFIILWPETAFKQSAK